MSERVDPWAGIPEVWRRAFEVYERALEGDSINPARVLATRGNVLALLREAAADQARWQWFRARAQVGVGEDADPFIAAWVGNEDSIPGLTDEQFTSVMEGDAGYATLDHAAAVDAIADAARGSVPSPTPTSPGETR